MILAAVLAEGVTVLSRSSRAGDFRTLPFPSGKRSADRRGRDGDDPDRGRFQPGGQRIYFFIGPDCGGDLSFRRSAHQRPSIPGRSGNRDAYRGPEGYRKDRGGGSHESQRDFSRCQGGLPSCGKSGNQPLSGLSDGLQSALLSAMTVARGKSEIEENIFEARFQTAAQLAGWERILR